MRMNFIQSLLVICPLLFLAGFIDSIAGGGGLISLPAFLLTGMPMHTALGTNKISASFGTTAAFIKFCKSGNIQLKAAGISALFSFFGSMLGSRLVLLIEQTMVQKMFLIVLPFIAVFILFKKIEEKEHSILTGTKLYVVCSVIGLAIGIYDGIIGPGTGTFLILAYTTLVGTSLIKSSGNAKLVNLASNIAAAITFIMNGKYVLSIALAAGLANLLGGFLGAGLAIKKGNKMIRYILFAVIIGIFIKLAIDVF